MYNKIGALEEFILLLVLIQKGEAYTVSLVKQYKEQTGSNISLPAIHTVLQQLEKKGFIESELTEPLKKRGGRSRRVYKINKSGYKILSKIQTEREELWKLAPKLSF